MDSKPTKIKPGTYLYRGVLITKSSQNHWFKFTVRACNVRTGQLCHIESGLSTLRNVISQIDDKLASGYTAQNNNLVTIAAAQRVAELAGK